MISTRDRMYDRLPRDTIAILDAKQANELAEWFPELGRTTAGLNLDAEPDVEIEFFSHSGDVKVYATNQIWSIKGSQDYAVKEGFRAHLKKLLDERAIVKVTLELPESRRSEAETIEITDPNEIADWSKWFIEAPAEHPAPGDKSFVVAWKPLWWIEFETANGNRRRVGFDYNFWLVEGKSDDYGTKPGFKDFFIRYFREHQAKAE